MNDHKDRLAYLDETHAQYVQRGETVRSTWCDCQEHRLLRALVRAEESELALAAEIDRLRAELCAEKDYSAEQFRARYAAETRLAAVIALLDEVQPKPYWTRADICNTVRAAATGDPK